MNWVVYSPGIGPPLADTPGPGAPVVLLAPSAAPNSTGRACSGVLSTVTLCTPAATPTELTGGAASEMTAAEGGLCTTVAWATGDREAA